MEKELLPQDKLREKIRYEIEKLRLGTISILTIGGGDISLILGAANTAAENLVLAVGMLIVLFAIVKTLRTYKKLNKRLYGTDNLQ